MYSWEKSLKEENSRKHPKNPSFSSSLLDEICRSIDGCDEKSQELKLYKERSSTKKQSLISNNGARAKSGSTVEDEEMESLKRACLIEKYMEKKVNEKVSSRRKSSTLPASELDYKLLFEDNDPLFFSSTSLSSSDSSSGTLSSSDTEFFASAKCRKSCFTISRPKPVRTSVSPRFGQQKDEFCMSNDCKDLESDKTGENLIKSKSRALKIYANLKKVKQPISPGGRLSSFINSLFTSGTPRKTKNFCSNGVYEDANIERKSKSKSSTRESTCSSASSFSRSCLSKTSPNSRLKLNDGAKRTVRFYPVSVIVDEDCRPCGHKRVYDEQSDKFGKPPLSQNSTELKLHLMQNNRKIEGVASENFKAYQNQKKETFVMERLSQGNNIVNDDEDEEDYDDEDAASDCSSDLFEIDHLALFRNNRFREELPVYETTHLDTNRAIANGLIR